MTRRHTAFLVCTWTFAAIAVTSVDAPSALRAVFVVPFVLVCPGFGWSARFLAVERDLGDLATFAVAISLGAAMIVGELLALSDRWSPTAGLLVLAAISFGGVATFFDAEPKRRNHRSAGSSGVQPVDGSRPDA